MSNDKDSKWKRNSGRSLIVLGVLLTVITLARTQHLSQQSSRDLKEHLQIVDSVVKRVEDGGRRQEKALTESLETTERTANKLEVVQDTASSNLALSAENIKATGLTADSIHQSQLMWLTVQRYLAESEACAERLRELDVEFQAALRMRQTTVRTIAEGISKVAQGNGTASFYRTQLLSVARQFKVEHDKIIEWEELEKMAGDKKSFQVLKREHEELRTPLDKIIERLSDENLSALNLHVVAHDLELWLLANGATWTHFHSACLRYVYESRANSLEAFRVLLEKQPKTGIPLHLDSKGRAPAQPAVIVQTPGNKEGVGWPLW